MGLEVFRAHPRSRGENDTSASYTGPILGSSPLTRGKPDLAAALGIANGLIPAHAGKTRSAAVSGLSGWAHPRSRGENPSSIPLATSCKGSSPLTRGKLIDVLVSQTRSGLIPAHAGKTPPANTPRPANWAHPRSRGENPSPVRPMSQYAGSSPLTRGKLAERDGIMEQIGLIPAHAGKTVNSS